MSTLPRAQKPKVPLLRVPLEGGPDYSLSDSEVSSNRLFVACPRLGGKTEKGEKREAEEWWDASRLGVECPRMFLPIEQHKFQSGDT